MASINGNGLQCPICRRQQGRYDTGHAWVEFFENGKCFLLDPTLRRIGDRMPRLSKLQYSPELSVAWDGKKLSYFAHKIPKTKLDLLGIAPLIPDWINLWG